MDQERRAYEEHERSWQDEQRRRAELAEARAKGRRTRAPASTRIGCSRAESESRRERNYFFIVPAVDGGGFPPPHSLHLDR